MKTTHKVYSGDKLVTTVEVDPTSDEPIEIDIGQTAGPVRFDPPLHMEGKRKLVIKHEVVYSTGD